MQTFHFLARLVGVYRQKRFAWPSWLFWSTHDARKTFAKAPEHTSQLTMLGEHFWEILTGRELLPVLLIGECGLELSRLEFFDSIRNPASTNLTGCLTAIGHLSKENTYQKNIGRGIKSGILYEPYR